MGDLPDRRAGARPTLTLFCGLPGAGKTTLARRLEGEGAGARLCTDDWMAALGVHAGDAAFHENLQSVLYLHALDLLDHGTDVILEDGLWTAAERAEKVTDAHAHGARVELHVFDVPYDVLWARLQQRLTGGEPGAYPLTRSELDWAWEVFEAPGAEELAGLERGGLDRVHHHREPQATGDAGPG